MFGYRRLGHNEGDEPSFTQPVLYQRHCNSRKSVREGYLDHLLDLGESDPRGGRGNRRASATRPSRRELSAGAGRKPFSRPPKTPPGVWTRGYYTAARRRTARTIADRRCARSGLPALLLKQTELPENFHPHPKIKKLLEAAGKWPPGKHRWIGRRPRRWPSPASAREGFRVRLSGQDSARGTFSQRHAVLYDYEDGEPLRPLAASGRQTRRRSISSTARSPKTGVLGFDYGYSLDCPDGLICWEAQFGDFVNAAQVIIDQFIASAEDKWNRLSGLVLLLPHGFEGQGPEHSSARLERFLNLGARTTSRSFVPTHARAVFSLPAAPGVAAWRKPLVVHDAQEPACAIRVPSRPGRMRAGPIPDGSCPIRANPAATGPAHPPVQRQNLLRTASSNARNRAATTSPSCAWSSFTRCPTLCCKRPWRRTRRARRCCGCRRSRRTWAPGVSARPFRRERFSGDFRWRASRVPPPPARPRARTAGTSANRPKS